MPDLYPDIAPYDCGMRESIAAALDTFEFGRIQDSELISKNRRAWIEIAVVVTHSATKVRTCASM